MSYGRGSLKNYIKFIQLHGTDNIIVVCNGMCTVGKYEMKITPDNGAVLTVVVLKNDSQQPPSIVRITADESPDFFSI